MNQSERGLFEQIRGLLPITGCFTNIEKICAEFEQRLAEAEKREKSALHKEQVAIKEYVVLEEEVNTASRALSDIEHDGNLCSGIMALKQREYDLGMRCAEAERERDQLIEKIIAHNERWAAEGGSVFSNRDQTFKNWDIKLTAPQQEQKS